MNAAAWAIAQSMGWKVEENYDFSTSDHPRAKQFWGAAAAAYESFFGDMPGDLDEELDEEEESDEDTDPGDPADNRHSTGA